MLEDSRHRYEAYRLEGREKQLRREESCTLDWMAGDIQWHLFCPVLRRGFIEEITMTLADWLDHAHAIQRATPLRVLRLTAQDDQDITQADTPLSMRYPHAFSYTAVLGRALRFLICDDKPRDNPVCRLHTLDLSRINVQQYELHASMDEAYRPWRGLKCLILPRWSYLEERYRGHEIERWKQRVPTLESVEFAYKETR